MNQFGCQNLQCLTSVKSWFRDLRRWSCNHIDSDHKIYVLERINCIICYSVHDILLRNWIDPFVNARSTKKGPSLYTQLMKVNYLIAVLDLDKLIFFLVYVLQNKDRIAFHDHIFILVLNIIHAIS